MIYRANRLGGVADLKGHATKFSTAYRSGNHVEAVNYSWSNLSFDYIGAAFTMSMPLLMFVNNFSHSPPLVFNFSESRSPTWIMIAHEAGLPSQHLPSYS